MAAERIFAMPTASVGAPPVRDRMRLLADLRRYVGEHLAA